MVWTLKKLSEALAQFLRDFYQVEEYRDPDKKNKVVLGDAFAKRYIGILVREGLLVERTGVYYKAPLRSDDHFHKLRWPLERELFGGRSLYPRSNSGEVGMPATVGQGLVMVNHWMNQVMPKDRESWMTLAAREGRN